MAMQAEERRESILEKLNRTNTVTVTDLSQEFGISEVTVRKDLQEMENDGFLRRTHGGAMRLNNAAIEPNMSMLEQANQEEKRAIARAAYEFVQDNDAIFLDASSTVRELGYLLKTGTKRNLTVITSSIKTSWELMGNEQLDIIQIGGNLRPNNYAVMGPLAVSSILSMRVDKAFIGVNGIDLVDGFSTPNLFECEVKKSILEASSTSFVLADHTKINRVMLGIICPISRVNYLITDDGMFPQIVEAIADQGTEVIVAKRG